MGFEAAGIAYSPTEFAAFTDPNDWRPKEFLLMKKTDCLALYGKENPVSLKYLKERLNDIMETDIPRRTELL